CFAVVVVHEWPDGKNKALKGSIRTPSVPRPISFYALAGRDPEPNTTIRKEEATWSRTSSCRCGSEQFIQKENFPEFTYRLFVLWNRVIYTKLVTHPDTDMTYVIINKYQLMRLKKVISSIDADAFVVIHDVRDVFGGSFAWDEGQRHDN